MDSGLGDLAEIKARRLWKTMNIWVSDTTIKVGAPVSVSGQLTRNEYIYLGRTTSGTLTVSDIAVQGTNAGLFQLSEFTSGTITSGKNARVKLTNLGLIKVDINGGSGFNNTNALESADFQAPASATGVALMSIPSTNGAWSTGSLNATGLSAVSKNSRTQLRASFEIDDDNDATSDYIGFYSGENATLANRPVLEVTYQ